MQTIHPSTLDLNPSGFQAQGSGGLGCRVRGSGFRVQGLGLGFGVRIWGLGSWVWGLRFGFRVQHLKSKHSLVKLATPASNIYPPTPWIPQHKENTGQRGVSKMLE